MERLFIIWACVKTSFEDVDRIRQNMDKHSIKKAGGLPRETTERDRPIIILAIRVPDLLLSEFGF